MGRSVKLYRPLHDPECFTLLTDCFCNSHHSLDVIQVNKCEVTSSAIGLNSRDSDVQAVSTKYDYDSPVVVFHKAAWQQAVGLEWAEVRRARGDRTVLLVLYVNYY